MYKVFFDCTAEKIFLDWKLGFSLLFPNVDKLLIQQTFPTARKIAIYSRTIHIVILPLIEHFFK